ncbi:hypothetical protein MANI_030318 [Metarhizium anisopliae]|nr:hypothetical protein MANI_030318 [Metarhizium anisopliae]
MPTCPKNFTKFPTTQANPPPTMYPMRARTPDEFERETDMTQWDEDEMDELETWLSMKFLNLMTATLFQVIGYGNLNSLQPRG